MTGRVPEIHSALARALTLLARRRLTAAEVRKRLAAAHYPGAEIEAALARLAEMRLLNDADLAHDHAAAEAKRLRGPERIQAQLEARGVDEAVASAAAPARDVAADARRLAEKHLATLGKLDRPAQARRLAGFLARQGYDEETVGAVLDQLGLME